ncbi:uncharacterized protein LOC125555792 [Triticum urartu]|uniref:uncharacterized protein LOC125555792 n=1 Tax=Triticum urartu TaxID=4572 RepID=UPI002043ED5A|nr:uncharacterized protein LOC125555792 [Triticum urartu]
MAWARSQDPIVTVVYSYCPAVLPAGRPAPLAGASMDAKPPSLPSSSTTASHARTLRLSSQPAASPKTTVSRNPAVDANFKPPLLPLESHAPNSRAVGARLRTIFLSIANLRSSFSSAGAVCITPRFPRSPDRVR